MAKSPKKPAEEPVTRKRGRPPGAKNKNPTPGQKLQAMRVEKARRIGPKKRKPSPPAVQELIPYAEEVGPGEGFGERGHGAGSAHSDYLSPEPSTANGQWAFMFPRRRGRKPILTCDPSTLDKLWDCGIMRCTKPETAAALGVSESTLERFFVEHPAAQAIWEDSNHAGNGSVRAELYAQALSGNTPALLHVAKHYLGMRDKFGPPTPGDDTEDPKQLQRIVIELVNAKDPAS
jgi:hypothetical protein